MPPLELEQPVNCVLQHESEYDVIITSPYNWSNSHNFYRQGNNRFRIGWPIISSHFQTITVWLVNFKSRKNKSFIDTSIWWEFCWQEFHRIFSYGLRHRKFNKLFSGIQKFEGSILRKIEDSDNRLFREIICSVQWTFYRQDFSGFTNMVDYFTLRLRDLLAL